VRQIVVMALGLVGAIAFYLVLGRSITNPFDMLLPAMGAGTPLLEDDSFIAQRSLVEPLDGVEQRRLREQRQLVQELARRHIGTPLSSGQSLEDLRVIQELLDKKLVKGDETYELQALGVALGDVIAAQLDLHWVAVEDDLGRSRALQWGEGEDLIFPITMISKRVEVDLRFSVEELYEKAEVAVKGFRMRASGSRRGAS
jgi:hypothetical protein